MKRQDPRDPSMYGKGKEKKGQHSCTCLRGQLSRGKNGACDQTSPSWRTRIKHQTQSQHFRRADTNLDSPRASACSRSSSTRSEHGRRCEESQPASIDQDSQARARKIAQAIKATQGPPRRYGTSGGYVLGPPHHTGTGLQFSDFHLGVI
eukprot:850090-Pelagomonas_calceolata.AAC.1